MLDKDIDGYLTFADIAVGNKDDYYVDLQLMFDFYQSANETMTYTDFLVAMIDLDNELGVEVYQKCFEMIDVEGREFITRQQIYDTIKNSPESKDQSKGFLKQMDRIIFENLDSKHIQNNKFLLSKQKYKERINGKLTLEDLFQEAQFPITKGVFVRIMS